MNNFFIQFIPKWLSRPEVICYLFYPSKSITAFYILFFSGFIISCNNNVVFYESQYVPDKVWKKSFGFNYNFSINDVSVPYNISLHLRNSNLYPYQNLWILLEGQYLSNVLINDTIEYKMADDKGKWAGSGVILFQNRIPLYVNYHFPDTGKYTIGIQHIMRDDRLKGIESIGLLIEKIQ